MPLAYTLSRCVTDCGIVEFQVRPIVLSNILCILLIRGEKLEVAPLVEGRKLLIMLYAHVKLKVFILCLYSMLTVSLNQELYATDVNMLIIIENY